MAKTKKKWLAFSVSKSKEISAISPGTRQEEGIVRIAASTKNSEPVVNHPYFQARERARFAGVGCLDVRKIKRKRKPRGLAGIAKAVASTDNAPSYHKKGIRKRNTTLLDLDDEIEVFRKG